MGDKLHWTILTAALGSAALGWGAEFLVLIAVAVLNLVLIHLALREEKP